MIRKNKYLILLVLLSASLLMNSCYKKRFSTDKLAGGEWNPEVAAPLIKSNLTMADIIKNSSEEWKEYPDGLLSLIYRQKVASSFGDSIVEIPDQSIDTSLSVTLPSAMIPGDSTSLLFNVFSKIVGSNNELIDSIFVKHGTLDFEITTDLNHDAKVQIIIPDLTKYGVTFYQTVKIPSAGGSTHTIKVSFPLNLYTAVFQHPNGNDNKIQEYLKVLVNFGPFANNSPYKLDIKQGISNLTYYYANGYFGQYNFSIDKKTLGISLFDNATVDEIYLEDPKLHLKFYNSFGIPAEVNMDEFYVERNGITKDFISTLLPTMPIGASTTMGVFDTTIYTFDKNNSNIIDLFAFQPKKVAFKETFLTNPAGIQAHNFIMDTSKIYLDAEVEMPMYGRALNFTMTDSADFSLEKDDGVISADLRFNLDNYFPAEAYVQIYLADSQNVILDSLLSYDQKVLVPAVVGPPPEYRTSQPLNQTTVVSLKGDRLKNFWNTDRIIFKATLSTSEQGQKVVKIYSDYSIDIRLAVKLNYLTEI